MFEPVDQNPDLPAMEERILARWETRQVFRQSQRQNPGGPLFRFYDGPPTANGRPGVHHVEARVFKDVFPRYRTMKGYRVPRRAGWDCHGIPVELEVERELGFSSKTDIEKYGVAAFNERCRESVTRYVSEFEDLTRRVGYWVDTEGAYWTMSAEYVDSVWWSLKTLYERGLMYEDYRVVPYCPRCGTALSDHEVSQGYREVEDLSVFVRLPLLTGPLSALPGEGAAGVSLLVWTTMPWTFMSTTAAVVGKGIRYVLARGGRAGDSPVVLAADRVEDALGPGAQVVRDVSVDEITGARYRGPFDYVGPGSASDPGGDPASWRVVVVGDFVTTDQGSGIVSTGAAFGEDDMRVARDNGLPVINPVRLDGRFDDRCGPYAGMDVRAADARIVEDLRRSGLLVHSHRYRHSYPFCWRCETPLIYYAKPSWYIETTRLRDRMLAQNDGVHWLPEHIRHGRYGDWLKNNVDWALSRERFWGTPLPIWRCGACTATVAVGSRADLGRLADRDLSGIDPHRPHVDAITLGCSGCGGIMRRVPEVIDAWYDSGAMPFAQSGYPHRLQAGVSPVVDELFPADFICEGIDQTRGWFYSLQAVSTALFNRSSYARALCLGHIVDAEGRKMSKSAGNVADPWKIISSHGADALRWLLLVEGSPWQPRRVNGDALREVTRKVLLTVWNTYYFFVTYARVDGWTPARQAPAVHDRPVMDRYILAELDDTVRAVDRGLDGFDVTSAGRRIARFVDDLSNWYVRCCRARFWGTGTADSGDTAAAFATLHTCLTTLALLIAPIMPFLADELFENLVRATDPAAPDSVHLARFPPAAGAPAGKSLREAMSDARALVSLGRDGRRAAGIPVRQPLARALVTMPPGRREGFSLVRDVVAQELNVRAVGLAGAGGPKVVTHTLKPDFRALGKVFGRRTQQAADAIRAADPVPTVAALRQDGRITLPAEGGPVTVDETMMSVMEEPVTGWHLSADGGYSIALDLTLDDDLRRAGLAREFARQVNELRKRAGFALSDRITLQVRFAEDPRKALRQAIEQHRDTIARDVLAVALTLADADSKTGGGASPGACTAASGPVPLQVGSGLLLIDIARSG